MKSNVIRYVAVVAGSMALGATLIAQTANKADKAPEKKDAAPAVDPGKVVMVVGDAKMTAGEFEDFISALPPEVQFMARGPAKRRIAEDLVKLKLLAFEARKQGLDQTPKFKQQVELMRDNALAGALLGKLNDNLVSDADVKKFYDDHKAEFERVSARHILIATKGEKPLSDEAAKAKATDLKKKLDAGGDFAALAKAESGDPGSKEDGGSLQPFTRGQMVPEFEKVAFEIEPNKISDPVKSEFGYHIIQVQKKDLVPFDEAKPQIADQLRPEKLEKFVDELKTKASPTLDDAFFGPAAKPKDAAAATDPNKK